MEGSSLFNPGFLGSAFLWWIGQIADDSTWRDNISFDQNVLVNEPQDEGSGAVLSVR